MIEIFDVTCSFIRVCVRQKLYFLHELYLLTLVLILICRIPLIAIGSALCNRRGSHDLMIWQNLLLHLTYQLFGLGQGSLRCLLVTSVSISLKIKHWRSEVFQVHWLFLSLNHLYPIEHWFSLSYRKFMQYKHFYLESRRNLYLRLTSSLNISFDSISSRCRN